MATTYYSPTEYGEGSCSENEYRNMFAKMVQLGTRHAVKLLENSWEGEDDEDDWRLVSPGGITVAELNSMIDDFFHCYCDYWTGPGDVFPLIESKINQYEANEPDDWGLELADAGRLGMQSAKTCKSNSCRSMFDSVFAMVEKLSGTSLAQGITYNSAPACDAAHAQKCWGGECWPIDREPGTSECKVCYAPTEPSSTLYPMAHMDDLADRIMFWASCSMSTDCPAADVSSYQFKFTVSASTSEGAFNAAKQEDFKERIADMLNRDAGLVAAVSANDVTLTITGSGSSLEVEVRINVYSETVKTSAQTTLGALENPSTASSKLGSTLTITGVSKATMETIAFAPPSPPPAGTDEKLSDAALAGIIVGAIVGLCGCFLGGALAFFFYQKLQQQKMKNSSAAKGSELSEVGTAKSEPVVARKC